MKKIIAIISAILIMVTTASADMAQTKKYENGTSYFVNGSQIIYIYPNTDTAGVSPDTAKLYMRKNICGNKDAKGLVDQGYKIVWIYPKGKSATIVTLDSCK